MIIISPHIRIVLKNACESAVVEQLYIDQFAAHYGLNHCPNCFNTMAEHTSHHGDLGAFSLQEQAPMA